MSENDFRAAFPLNNHEFVAREEYWICRLVEVSDMRPQADRLSWYLLFQAQAAKHGQSERTRRLEIVTHAGAAFPAHWKPDLRDRLAAWLSEGGEDDRVEWLDG